MSNVTYSKLSDLVGNANASITTIFREKGSCWSSGWHNGIDIAVAQGTPIKAAADGVVVNADTVAHNDGFGNRVILRHADGRATLYAHMVSAPPVKVGQAVKKGEVIGKVGNTGLSYGAHLHFTMLDNYDRNPNIYYKGDLLDPIKVCGLGTITISGGKTIVENGVSKYISNLNAYYSVLNTEKTESNVKTSDPEIKIGSTVTLRRDSTDYNGGKLAAFVYNRPHIVSEIKGDRAVICYDNVVVAAVNVNNLIVESSVKNYTSTPTTQNIKVGSTVMVKLGAKTYTGGYLAPFVSSRKHVITELVRDRAVICYGSDVVAAVNIKDLMLA